MGTNFYWLPYQYSDDIQSHIGKRSGAGQYCWDCGTTLCKDGSDGVHSSESEWFEECPSCGGSKIFDSKAGPQSGVQSGVQAVCSFTWSLLKHKRRCLDIMASGNSEDKVIVDEYGNQYTAAEFLNGEVERCCPIQYQLPVMFC